MSHNTVKKGTIEITARENKKGKSVENRRMRREGKINGSERELGR
jgi:hypothetical protein